MKKNMGIADRVIRLIVAAIIGGLFFSKVIFGAGGLLLLIIAVVFLLTGLIGTCPLYSIFKIRTCKK